MSNQYECGLAIPLTFNKQGFIAAYKEAFGGPPYYEEYSDEEVLEEVLEPHLKDGVVMYVNHGGRLIGFGCALPFDKSPDDVKEFLEGLYDMGELPKEFKHRDAWYMSELGVLNEYRGRGAAWELVRARMVTIDRRGQGQFFMRTAWPNSKSMPMYIKCGAKPLGPLQDVSDTSQATENHTKSLQRVYLWGDCMESAHKIKQIQDEKGYIPFDSDEDGQEF